MGQCPCAPQKPVHPNLRPGVLSPDIAGADAGFPRSDAPIPRGSVGQCDLLVDLGFDGDGPGVGNGPSRLAIVRSASIRSTETSAFDTRYLREMQALPMQPLVNIPAAPEPPAADSGGSVALISSHATEVAARVLAIPPPKGSRSGDRRAAADYIAAYTTRSRDWGHPPPIRKGEEQEREPTVKEAKLRRTAALRWLAAALTRQAAHDAAFLLKPHFWLISNARLWPDPLNNSEPGFAALKALATGKLNDLGRRYEATVYKAKGLGALLGGLGAELDGVHPRQDSLAGLAFPGDGCPEVFLLPPLDPQVSHPEPLLLHPVTKVYAMTLLRQTSPLTRFVPAGPQFTMHPSAEGGYLYMLCIASMVLDPAFQVRRLRSPCRRPHG